MKYSELKRLLRKKTHWLLFEDKLAFNYIVKE